MERSVNEDIDGLQPCNGAGKRDTVFVKDFGCVEIQVVVRDEIE